MMIQQRFQKNMDYAIKDMCLIKSFRGKSFQIRSWKWWWWRGRGLTAHLKIRSERRDICWFYFLPPSQPTTLHSPNWTTFPLKNTMRNSQTLNSKPMLCIPHLCTRFFPWSWSHRFTFLFIFSVLNSGGSRGCPDSSSLLSSSYIIYPCLTYLILHFPRAAYGLSICYMASYR